MRFFSELGSCWSGTVVIPPPELRRHTEERGLHCHSRRRRTTKRPAHWTPKLNAISENSPISDAVNGGGIRRTDDGKRPAKPNLKSPAKPVGLTEDYWNLSPTMVLPAFSPTSYLF